MDKPKYYDFTRGSLDIFEVGRYLDEKYSRDIGGERWVDRMMEHLEARNNSYVECESLKSFLEDDEISPQEQLKDDFIVLNKEYPSTDGHIFWVMW